MFFFFKQKTAYEMRISDWSSDVCSSDLAEGDEQQAREDGKAPGERGKTVEQSCCSGAEHDRDQRQRQGKAEECKGDEAAYERGATGRRAGQHRQAEKPGPGGAISTAKRAEPGAAHQHNQTHPAQAP